MRFQIFFFLLFSTTILAQNPLKIVITSIKSNDNENGYREFEVNYTFENTATKPISFINCEYPIALSYPDVTKPVGELQLFENDRLEVFNPIENSNKYISRLDYLKSNLSEAELKAMEENHLSDFQKDSIWRKRDREKRLKINDFEYVKSAIITLNPKEIKTYQHVFYWTKQRYFKTENLEFYFDDSNKYSCRLNFIFYKDEFRYFFSEEEFKDYENDSNFLKGDYQSNVYPIQFLD